MMVKGGGKMNSKMRRTQIYLSKDQHAFLSSRAQKEGVSVAELIRQYIAGKMPKEEDYENNPLFNMARKTFRMGRSKGSEDHDEYLYRGKE
jgi:hypothetical protein